VTEDKATDACLPVVDRARAILHAGPICDDCLGRAFARLGHGLSNGERGRAARRLASQAGTVGRPGTCWVCQGLFDQVGDWADRAASLTRGIEHDTYLVGVHLSPRLEEAERLFAERFGADLSEPLRHAFNREVGKAYEKLLGRGTVALEHPHVWFTVDLRDGSVALRVASLYVYGRYRKLARDIPQTHWPCRRCRGRGCEACGGTGKRYPESVEELISGPFVEASQASAALLHGAGREDIDARMLGTGRPFVLELVAPHRRSLDLRGLEAAANRVARGRVEIASLRLVSPDVVGRIKEAAAEKVYVALVQFAEEVSEERLRRALGRLLGPIEQETPRRVLHRRADLLRRRRVLEIEGDLLAPGQARLTLRCEGGLYVKELVSGDEGRTSPSLSGTLGVPARVLELDVMSVTSDQFPA